MKLPDFLIIGAMKAGTTTLYRDLLTNPQVFLPAEKEPGSLLSDEVRTVAGRRRYARHFRGAAPDQVCGEASTGYSKLPEHRGVPRRARDLLGDRLRVVYLVRDPVSRIISQHHHELNSGRVTCGVDEAVRRYPRYLDYTRYAMQVTPWIDTFGRDRVLIVRFESFVADRVGTVRDVSRFLGVEPRCESIRTASVYNRSEGKWALRGPFARVQRSRLYRSIVRPLFPLSARERLRGSLLPAGPPRPAPPSAQTVDLVLDSLAADLRALQRLLGSPAPLWPAHEMRGRDAAADDAA